MWIALSARDFGDLASTLLDAVANAAKNAMMVAAKICRPRFRLVVLSRVVGMKFRWAPRGLLLNLAANSIFATR